MNVEKGGYEIDIDCTGTPQLSGQTCDEDNRIQFQVRQGI